LNLDCAVTAPMVLTFVIVSMDLRVVVGVGTNVTLALKECMCVRLLWILWRLVRIIQTKLPNCYTLHNKEFTLLSLVDDTYWLGAKRL
jgi:hypothetical protein